MDRGQDQNEGQWGGRCRGIGWILDLAEVAEDIADIGPGDAPGRRCSGGVGAGSHTRGMDDVDRPPSGRTESGPELARCLAELPERRREWLLWRELLRHDYDGVDALLGEYRERLVCRPSESQTPGDCSDATAVRGDDGRFHLRRDDHLVCTTHRYRIGPMPPPIDAPQEHEQGAYWCTDGSIYRVYAPRDADPATAASQDRYRTFRWTVQLTSETTDPAGVPRRERCPVNTHYGHWPPYDDPSTPKGRLRRRLIKEFGPLCAICETALGVFIDHDHFTGAVRGLLCHLCNNALENCPHVSGCPRADYLASPPAASLGLLYPKRGRDRIRDWSKIAMAGFDPYELKLRPSRTRQGGTPAGLVPDDATSGPVQGAEVGWRGPWWQAAVLAWDAAWWRVCGRRRARRRRRAVQAPLP